MAILYGLTDTGAQVPVQVDNDGRLVAEGLQGSPGPMGPSGPAGSTGPAGPAGGSGMQLWSNPKSFTLTSAHQVIWEWPLFVDPNGLLIQRMQFEVQQYGTDSNYFKNWVFPFFADKNLSLYPYEFTAMRAEEKPGFFWFDFLVWVRPNGEWRLESKMTFSKNYGGHGGSDSVDWGMGTTWNSTDLVTNGSKIDLRWGSSTAIAGAVHVASDLTRWSYESISATHNGLPSSI